MPDYPKPEDLKHCRRGAEWAAAVSAATLLGLFEAIAEGSNSRDSLAAALEADPRGLGILLGVLEVLELVDVSDGEIRLTQAGRAHFVDRDSGVYQGAAAERWNRLMRNWLMLDEAVIRGGPLDDEDGDGDEDEDEAEEDRASFMALMAARPQAQVRRLVEACLRRKPDAETLLDLGGGPGVHSRAFTERGLEATLMDRPEVIGHVKKAYELKGQPEIELVEGDFLETLPEGPYDVVLLANITHIYDAETNRTLISRVAGLQEPGSIIAIQDFVRGRSAFAPLFAITMLLQTERGNTYSEEAYRAWLEDAGYAEMLIEDVDDDRQIVTAVRQGASRD